MLIFEINPSTFDGNNNPPETQVEDVVLVNPDGNWHLYNHGSLELTRDADIQYIDLWDVNIPLDQDVLIIGGGDYELAFNLNVKADVVDPCVNLYKEFHEFYLEYDKEALLRYNSQITNFPYTFGEYIDNYYKGKNYALTLIDISEPQLGLTDEIYSEEFFITLKNKVNCDLFMMYIPPSIYNKLIHWIRKHFSMLNSNEKFIEDWDEQTAVITFQR